MPRERGRDSAALRRPESLTGGNRSQDTPTPFETSRLPDRRHSRIKHLMADRGAHRMIERILHNMAEEPAARTLFEVGVIESAVCRITVRSRHDGIHDICGIQLRWVLRISDARRRKVVLGIRAVAHRRKLVLPIDHVVQSVRESGSAHPIEDDMRNRMHRFLILLLGLLSKRTRSRFASRPDQTLPSRLPFLCHSAG